MLSVIAYHGKNASRSWAPAVRSVGDALSTSTPQRQRTLSLLLVATYSGPAPCPQGTLSLVGWHMTVKLYEYPLLGIPCATRRIRHLLLAFSKCRSNDWPVKPGEVSALLSCTELCPVGSKSRMFIGFTLVVLVVPDSVQSQRLEPTVP